MPKADTDNTPSATTDADALEWPLGALEPIVLDLQTTVAVFGHLIYSPDEVDKNTWTKVETDLIDAAVQIEIRSAVLDFLREQVPRNWHRLCDAVTDNFRVIDPANFRVLG
jgi:hypothetical protein